jgi:hypothetical protein
MREAVRADTSYECPVISDVMAAAYARPASLS